MVAISELLTLTQRNGASDLHLSAKKPPIMRINGMMTVLETIPPLAAEQVKSMVFALMTEYQRAEFEYRKQSTNIQQEIADFVKQKEANLAKLTEFINKGKNEIKQQVDDVKSALRNTEKVVMDVEQTAKDLGVPMPIPVKEAKQLIDSIGSLVRNVNSYVR